ncbi:MAG: acyltransferase [Alphaproteobacteria bacterium]
MQNGVSIHAGLSIGRFCFVGPHVIFTNDARPRAGNKRWTLSPTVLADGCAIGAGSVIRCGITIGAYAMIGAGSLVTRDVEPFHLVVGRPGSTVGLVCACGQSSLPPDPGREALLGECCRELMSPASLAVARGVVAGLDASPGRT